MNGDKEAGKPYRLEHEMVFDGDYRITVNVTSPQPGFLYILNKGDVESGDRTFNLLRPLPGQSAQRPASGEPSELKLRFDRASGRELLYLIWSREAVPEMEQVANLPSVQHGIVVVTDAARVKTISDFLQAHASRVVAERKDEQTQLRTDDQVLVHAIPLEHL